jgi:hypothetical protein
MLRMNRKSACLSAASVIALSICISTESYARSTLPPLGATVNSYGANSVFDTIKVRGFEVPIYLDGLRLPVDPGTTFASSLPNLFGQLNANNLTNKYYARIVPARSIARSEMRAPCWARCAITSSRDRMVKSERGLYASYQPSEVELGPQVVQHYLYCVHAAAVHHRPAAAVP